MTRCFSTARLNLKVSKEQLARHQEQLMKRGLPKKRTLSQVSKVVLVASGKGGVGKSTTAVNLSMALSRDLDLRVGLLDADVFGPSVHVMMGLEGKKPEVTMEKEMVPLKNLGLECMSMGFLVDPEQAVVWRGPMVMGAVEKMIFGTKWSELDVLVVDLPPGTGDVHLSIAQTLEGIFVFRKIFKR